MQIALNHSSDTEFKDFMKLYEDYCKEPYSFLVNDITLPSRNQNNLEQSKAQRKKKNYQEKVLRLKTLNILH